MLPKLASREQISNPREKKNRRCDCERSDRMITLQVPYSSRPSISASAVSSETRVLSIDLASKNGANTTTDAKRMFRKIDMAWVTILASRAGSN
jgi:hypothetical protein